jgi:hypothetical protein
MKLNINTIRMIIEERLLNSTMNSLFNRTTKCKNRITMRHWIRIQLRVASTREQVLTSNIKIKTD